ncbi:MAG: AAA family ATPase [Bryobacteraceae bacterium]|nr:AAA family ATPase [Bryobacteraceae bacterium]
MFLQSLHLRDVLSFRDCKLELKPLNVLIGANGSGKSNFLDAISLLPGFTADSAAFLRTQGGPGAWLSKGIGAGPAAKLAFQFDGGQDYEVVFGAFGPSLHIYAEYLRKSGSKSAVLTRHESEISGRTPIANYFKSESPQSERSLLSYLFPAQTEWRAWQDSLRKIRTYRLAGFNEIRQGVPIGSGDRYLSPTGDNLAKLIHDFYQAGLADSIDEALQRFGENYRTVKHDVSGQYWSLRLDETRLEGSVSASRISDGTLRFLQLLVILRHPDPPPLILIEEPELGLHPDAIRIVAEELLVASDHTQLVVTTHSTELISALQQTPDSILVCEKDFDNATSVRRLDGTTIRRWLKEFSSLGELWLSGAIGGTRW